jgi:hypothetical protein
MKKQLDIKKLLILNLPYRRYHVGAVYLHLHRDLWPYD